LQKVKFKLTIAYQRILSRKDGAHSSPYETKDIIQ